MVRFTFLSNATMDALQDAGKTLLTCGGSGIDSFSPVFSFHLPVRLPITARLGRAPGQVVDGNATRYFPITCPSSLSIETK